jgi:peptidyl-prolyl cis-trans isomerase SurA
MYKFVLITTLFLINCNLINAQKDPVILQIDDITVTKSEFLQIYLKNNPNPKFDAQSLDEYMELFKKFKVKVIEAEDLGYDTIPKLKKELEGYRKQLAQPYLVDKNKNEELVKEAYYRTLNDVRASHILVRLESTASPEDTLAAYNRIMGLKSRIEKGEDFESVARGKNGSDDPSVLSNGGDLGYFNAFQMVYSFEDMAYNTAVGKISEPFRTRFGYHILKVTDLRPARGTMRSAHIMIAAKKTDPEDEIMNASKKINEIYEKLKNGESFEALAKEYSDDASSNLKGGELDAFGTGTSKRMIPIFEETAFALANDGDYSAPIQTDYGFHIIKRIELKPVREYEEMKKELQIKVNRDDRAKKTQDSFVNKLKKSYKYKNLSKESLQWFYNNMDTTYFSGTWTANNLTSDDVLFRIDGETFKQQQFAIYLENNYRNVKKADNISTVNEQYKNWEKETILNIEDNKLTSKYPEYKALLTEYHDGILLYEIMNDKVWQKAINDTLGLKNYFDANRSNYNWNERLDAVVYICADNQVANQVYNMIQNDTINSKHVIDVINKESSLPLSVKTNKFDISQTNYLTDKYLEIGANAPYEFDGKYYVIKVIEKLNPKQKEFSEAKGAITSDYQNFLEQEWINTLYSKHKITVNSKNLYAVGKGYKKKK